LLIRQIPTQDEEGICRWLALRDQDRLLRRFGQAEVVRVSPEARPDLQVRVVADEVWALVEGEAEFVWHDLRPASPTHDAKYRAKYAQPTLLLVPFGVAFGYRALGGEALMLRLSSHADGEHDRDRKVPWTSNR
jgi:dTDP-4-dehydrorhamnose 3,5-epimerase